MMITKYFCYFWFIFQGWLRQNSHVRWYFYNFPTILPHLHFVRGGSQSCPTSFVQFYMLCRYIKMDKTYWMHSRGYYTEFRLRVENDVIRPSSKIRIQIRPFKNTDTEPTLKKSTGSWSNRQEIPGSRSDPQE